MSDHLRAEFKAIQDSLARSMARGRVVSERDIDEAVLTLEEIKEALEVLPTVPKAEAIASSKLLQTALSDIVWRLIVWRLKNRRRV